MLRIALVTAALVLASPAARAEETNPRVTGAFVWGITGFEVATTSVLMLRFTYLSGDLAEPGEGLLLTAPFLVGTAVGIAAYLWCLPPRVGHALHGGMYTGLLAGLGEALVRGALALDGTLRFDRYAGIAALVGTIPGILIGALEVEPDDPLQFWLGGPPAGMLAGVVIAGVLAVVLFLSGNDPGPGTGDQVIGWPIFAGLAGGLVVASGSVIGDDRN